ncbi:MAG TPA: 3'(2'),5'-bisphosphate nucleotidase CysQ [Alphaproteobacteria bacterium]|nr:3'(2'),5'-bisphosphate nucleotidase CysQ [Alphaproteobacteria bacterium]
MTHPLAGLLPELKRVAEEAGRATMRFYGAPEAVWKADGSPVTAADHASEKVILPALRALTPDIPVISEEEAAAGVSPEVRGSRFWLVDPLDGTKEFIKQNGEFTINIALVEDHVPTLGVVHVPVTGETYAAAGPGSATLSVGGAAAREIAVRKPPTAGLTIVASRSHGDGEAMDRFLDGLKVAERRPAGSSVKLCLVARGDADLYPRLGPTMEWDIAAGHAVLLGAGGRIETEAGEPLLYGKPDFRNPHFVAYGGWDKSVAETKAATAKV